jgi:LPS-assembly protein
MTNEFRDLNRDGINDSDELSIGKATITNAPVYYDLDSRETVPLSGTRYNLNYNIELPLRSAGAFVTPKVGVRHVTQQLNETTLNTPDSNPSTTAAFASVDSGLIFERESQWFGNDYRQTLEPRLFYYYSQQKNQDDIYSFDSNSLSYSYAQLFRDYRLAGEDFIDDANQISTGVSSRLLSPTTGRELVRVGIGQTYYLEKREVVLEIDPATTAYEQNRSKSDLVLDASAHLSRHWETYTETLWNEDHGKRDRQSLACVTATNKAACLTLAINIWLVNLPSTRWGI